MVRNSSSPLALILWGTFWQEPIPGRLAKGALQTKPSLCTGLFGQSIALLTSSYTRAVRKRNHLRFGFETSTPDGGNRCLWRTWRLGSGRQEFFCQKIFEGKTSKRNRFVCNFWNQFLRVRKSSAKEESRGNSTKLQKLNLFKESWSRMAERRRRVLSAVDVRSVRLSLWITLIRLLAFANRFRLQTEILASRRFRRFRRAIFSALEAMMKHLNFQHS